MFLPFGRFILLFFVFQFLRVLRCSANRCPVSIIPSPVPSACDGESLVKRLSATATCHDVRSEENAKMTRSPPVQWKSTNAAGCNPSVSERIQLLKSSNRCAGLRESHCDSSCSLSPTDTKPATTPIEVKWEFFYSDIRKRNTIFFVGDNLRFQLFREAQAVPEGALSFSIWVNREAPIEAMRSAIAL